MNNKYIQHLIWCPAGGDAHAVALKDSLYHYLGLLGNAADEFDTVIAIL